MANKTALQDQRRNWTNKEGWHFQRDLNLYTKGKMSDLNYAASVGKTTTQLYDLFQQSKSINV